VRLSFNKRLKLPPQPSVFHPAMPDTLPLSFLPTGQCGRIDQLVGRPDEIHRLQELGMRIGTPIEMLQSGATCIVKLDGTRLAFRDHDGCRVLVKIGDAS
jgi:ferrous iron transport protein A